MAQAKTMKQYHKEIKEALDDGYLRQTLDKFAVAYKANRKAIFADVNEKELIKAIADGKDAAIERLEELYGQFKAEAEKRGLIVHRAATAAEANEIMCRIAKENGVKKIIKSKSMTAEETHMNHALEAEGFEVSETDLGEWIIQLREEPPTHMVMPAIHLSRYQVADTFTEATSKQQDSDITKLVRVARRELRAKFAQADMGISGANFAIAETGTIAICTNEGNGRLTTTLPRVHVAICGIDKLTPSIHDAMQIIRVLPRNATSQIITSYVSWMTGTSENTLNPDKKKIMHVIFLDNGRSEMGKDPLTRQALRCVRCGACANVCPVYRLVGGHKMGYVYIGAIGLILTYFFHGKENAKALVQNCINCEACKDICAADIDLPAIIQEIRARLNEEDGAPLESGLLGKVMKNRKLFHTLLRFAKFSQRPFTGGSKFQRHLPAMFMKGQEFRALPAIAAKPFRDEWPALKKKIPAEGKLRVGIFAGCAQDFVYPEQLAAAVELFAANGCSVDFPMQQSCCGLPLKMMGQRKVGEAVAEENVKAFAEGEYDYIITLCASCASFIKHNYPQILAHRPELTADTARFASSVKDFSSFVRDVLKLGEANFAKSSEGVVYHSPCHLCRGLGVIEQPRELLEAAGDYKRTDEEDVCCGFGGTYSIKFPEISSQLLEMKLKRLEEAGAETLVTDCPGCIMQLRGGEERRGRKLKVEHMSEFLARHRK